VIPDSLVAALAGAADTCPPEDRVTFVDGREEERSFHWSEVWQRAERAAGALYAAGVRPHDRVAIVLPTAPSFLDALFGCHLLGAVPVPLYPPVRLGRLDEYVEKTSNMMRAVDAAALVTDARVGRVLGQVAAKAAPRLGRIDADTLANGPRRPVGPIGADDLALIQVSSGTTVDPKPVALTHRQVVANVDAILDFIPRNVGIKQAGCCWLPLYHDMGLIGVVFTCFVGKGPLVLIPPEQFLAKPGIWLRALSRHRSTVSPAPNFAYALCAERVTDDEIRGVDLSEWRLALNGAEPVAPRSLRAFQDRFRPFGLRDEALTPVYGLAEAALAVTFSDPSRPFRTFHLDRAALAAGRAEVAADGVELVSVGRPLRGFDVELRDADGAPVPDGVVGRIHAKGPSVMRGYFGRTEQPIHDGWLDTGDLGVRVDGELVITGRAKDLIVLRGKNHAPQDLEQAVDGVAGVRTGCAVAVGDVGPDGERLLLFVEAREPREGLAEDCRVAVKAATGLDPALVVVVDPGTIPRTSSGKLRRGETLRRFHAGALLPPDAVTPLRLAGALARSWIGWTFGR
jgi:fatty-acyl-CoA synthase